ncbi:MAG: DNA mismatch repair endonuclease MutL [Candidatus Binataceae bacterium]|jgi:DNA mismatch repair protein MutL
MAERLIHILPEQVASQIAAGEVVERPASAVKELIENSLDAGARSISIEISGGGRELIAITDDGCGMSRADAILCLRRHATSKIRDAADLAAIGTLGFRGEALASIASVSRLELKTRRPEDMTGVHLSVVGGEVTAERECAMAAGTRIEARELFFNTPARLKFLKQPPTEQSAIAEAVQRLALGNYGVAFALIADGRPTLELARARGLLERIRQLFGPKLAERMIPFALERDAIRVKGLATVSQDSFPTARMLFTFVNGRAVRDRLLARAIAQAYATLLPRGRYPAVVLDLEVSAGEVDVNVHPMKTEVRFRRSNAVFEAVYYALRNRLANQTGVASSGGAAIAPAGAAAAPPDGDGRVGDANPPQVIDEADAARPLRLVLDAAPVAARPEQPALAMGYDRSASSGVRAAVAEVAEAVAVVGASSSSNAAVVNQLAPALAKSGAVIPMYSRLRIIGQVFAGYIALESDDGLMLVDQHAAHERVTFERLRGELRNGGIQVQARLVPEPLELDSARAAQIQAAVPQLRALGFEVEPFGPATILLKGAPAVFGAEAGVKLLADMIDSMGESGFELRGEQAFDDCLKQLACHGSVRVGRVLEEREIRELLAQLDRTQFKTNCPHGRPVHIQFGRGQIERMFRR